jgi:hypothetical protein
LFPKAELWLGGIYASLMPEHAKRSGADHVHVGVFEVAENLRKGVDLIIGEAGDRLLGHRFYA